MWKSFENFDERCSLRTWIYRVAHNVATSQVVRKKSKSPAFVTLDEIDTPVDPQNVEHAADRHKALARLLALIQRLELIDRQLILRYLEGLDAESISQISGLSSANVWTRIHRIKNVLVRQFHSGGTNAP